MIDFCSTLHSMYIAPPPPTELCVTSNCDTMGILRDAILRDNNTRGYCYTNEDCTKGVCDAVSYTYMN